MQWAGLCPSCAVLAANVIHYWFGLTCWCQAKTYLLTAGFEWTRAKVKFLLSFQDLIFSKHNRGMLWAGRSEPKCNYWHKHSWFYRACISVEVQVFDRSSLSLLTLSLEDIWKFEVRIVCDSGVVFFGIGVCFELPPFFSIFPVQKKKIVQEMELWNCSGFAVCPKEIIVFLDCSCLEWYNPFSGYLVFKMEKLWQIYSGYCAAKMCINECMFLITGICDCLLVCDFF